MLDNIAGLRGNMITTVAEVYDRLQAMMNLRESMSEFTGTDTS